MFMRCIVACTTVTVSLFFISCISTKPLPKSSKQPSKQSIKQQEQLPDGWADITEKANLPEIKRWLVNRDYSATIVLKELQADDSTKKILLQEELCTVARISLQLKVGENAGERRVTRIPERMNGASCSYVYEEKGLLRRVIVYKTGKGFFELELMQENQSANFESLTNDQIIVLKVLSKN